MQIEKNNVVTFRYKLSEKDGKELENTFDADPTAYLHGYRNILPELESGLEGLKEGDSKVITLEPNQAYGPRNEEAKQRVPIKHLASRHKRLKAGDLVKVNAERGAVDAKVVKVGKFNVDLDMNHPYAGKTLVFEVSIAEIREASKEELTHGHAHGIGGHHH